MKKYIIKNCPARSDGFCGDDRKELFCIDVSDCLLKQIAKECGLYSPDGGFNDSEAQDLANLILDKLEIDEVDE